MTIEAPEGFASTPAPPYYVVIFSSTRTDQDPAGYEAASARMVELARRVPGYLGMETARDERGFGITTSYWASEDAIRAWKMHAEHVRVRERGRRAWYAHFEVRVARVTRAYGQARVDGE
ncbi:antibiotic biosynthesis monooxygenase [Luteimonas pelagia]